MTVFAPNKIVLLFGEFLCGLPWGVFASSAPAYASEVLPLALRGTSRHIPTCRLREFV